WTYGRRDMQFELLSQFSFENRVTSGSEDRGRCYRRWRTGWWKGLWKQPVDPCANLQHVDLFRKSDINRTLTSGGAGSGSPTRSKKSASPAGAPKKRGCSSQIPDSLPSP